MNCGFDVDSIRLNINKRKYKPSMYISSQEDNIYWRVQYFLKIHIFRQKGFDSIKLRIFSQILYCSFPGDKGPSYIFNLFFTLDCLNVNFLAKILM